MTRETASGVKMKLKSDAGMDLERQTVGVRQMGTWGGSVERSPSFSDECSCLWQAVSRREL